MLFLAGAYEFAQAGVPAPPPQKRLAFMARAFESIRHDILFVTPQERQFLAKAGVHPSSRWQGSDHLEQHILHPEGGPKVGVLLLPALPDGTHNLTPGTVHQVEEAVGRLRATCKVVVAMSPWGYALEQELLNTRGPLPDVLLGSGPGIGLVGTIAGGGRTVWVRSYAQGKSVHRIDLLAWPEQTPTFKWTEEQNVRMSLFGLTDQYQENPQLLELMRSMGAE